MTIKYLCRQMSFLTRIVISSGVLSLFWAGASSGQPQLIDTILERVKSEMTIHQSELMPLDEVLRSIEGSVGLDEGAFSSSKLTVYVDGSLSAPVPKTLTFDGLQEKVEIIEISLDELYNEICTGDPSLLDGDPFVALGLSAHRLPDGCKAILKEPGKKSFDLETHSDSLDLLRLNVGLSGFILVTYDNEIPEDYKNIYGALSGPRTRNALAAAVNGAVNIGIANQYKEFVIHPGHDRCICTGDYTVKESLALILDDPNWFGCETTDDSGNPCAGDPDVVLRSVRPMSWDLSDSGTVLDTLSFSEEGVKTSDLVEDGALHWCNVDPTFPCSKLEVFFFHGGSKLSLSEKLICGLSRADCSLRRYDLTSENLNSRSDDRYFPLGELDERIGEIKNTIGNAGEFSIFAIPLNLAVSGFDFTDLVIVDPRGVVGAEDLPESLLLKIQGISQTESVELAYYPFVFGVDFIVPGKFLGDQLVFHYISSVFALTDQYGICQSDDSMCQIGLSAALAQFDPATIWFNKHEQ